MGSALDGIEGFTREIEDLEVGDDHLSTRARLFKFPPTDIACTDELVTHMISVRRRDPAPRSTSNCGIIVVLPLPR